MTGIEPASATPPLNRLRAQSSLQSYRYPIAARQAGLRHLFSNTVIRQVSLRYGKEYVSRRRISSTNFFTPNQSSIRLAALSRQSVVICVYFEKFSYKVATCSKISVTKPRRNLYIPIQKQDSYLIRFTNTKFNINRLLNCLELPC